MGYADQGRGHAAVSGLPLCGHLALMKGLTRYTPGSEAWAWVS